MALSAVRWHRMTSVIVLAALLIRDTIIVADGSDLVLRYFDLRGNALKTVGRKGAGPGEYENIRTLQRAGDSLLIHDAQQERATLLHTRVVRLGTRMRPTRIVTYHVSNAGQYYPHVEVERQPVRTGRR